MRYDSNQKGMTTNLRQSRHRTVVPLILDQNRQTVLHLRHVWGEHGNLQHTEAMYTVVVSKQSCKHGNHPILRGVNAPHQEFLFFTKNHDFSRFLIIFSRLLWWNIGVRPEAPSSYSLTSWPELIVVIHGEYIPPGTHSVNLLEGHDTRTLDSTCPRLEL